MAVQVGDLTVKLGLDSTSLTAGLGQARAKMGALSADFIKAGAGLTAGITLPIVAIGTASIKSAIEFESSFAGIRKTVNATEEEFAALSEGMREISLIKPIDVNELNKIGEAAGQLGIKKENILEFTKVMADLGVTTNLTSDQAATSLARLANIMQTPQEQFDRMGSTIVALGNNFATTEAEIVEMGLRLAGAGKIVGLTEAQVFGLSAAMTSVGINAEAGGTAMSRVLKDIAVEVATSGDKLELFAEVAGQSTEAFARSFKDDAAVALQAFINGLGQMQKEGGNVLSVLKELKLDNVRVSDALLRTSGAGNLVAESMALATKAFEENTALTKEAEQRYKTMASQLTVFWNRIKDVAITLGTALLPVMSDMLDIAGPMIDMFADLVKGFSDMDAATKKTVLIFVGAFAATGPILVVVGAFMAAMIAITAPMLAGGAMIVGIVAGIGTIISNWKELKELGVTIWKAMLGAISGQSNASTKLVTRMWKLFTDDMKDLLKNLVFAVKETFSDMVGFVTKPVKQLTDAVLGRFKSLADKLVFRSIVPDMVDAIGGEFQRLNTDLVGARGIVPITVDQVVSDFQLMSDDSLSVGVGFREKMLKEFETMDDQIARSAVPSMTEGVTDSFQLMTTRVTQTIMPEFVEETATLWEEMSAGLSASMSSAMSEMVTGVLRGTQDMGDVLKGFNDNILLKFGEDAFKQFETRFPKVAEGIQASLLGIGTAVDIFGSFKEGETVEAIGKAVGAGIGAALAAPGGPLAIALGATAGAKLGGGLTGSLGGGPSLFELASPLILSRLFGARTPSANITPTLTPGLGGLTGFESGVSQQGPFGVRGFTDIANIKGGNLSNFTEQLVRFDESLAALLTRGQIKDVTTQLQGMERVVLNLGKKIDPVDIFRLIEPNITATLEALKVPADQINDIFGIFAGIKHPDDIELEEIEAITQQFLELIAMRRRALAAFEAFQISLASEIALLRDTPIDLIPTIARQFRQAMKILEDTTNPEQIVQQAERVRSLIQQRHAFELASLQDMLSVVQEGIASASQTIGQWTQSLSSLDDQIRSMQLSTLDADAAFAQIQDEFKAAVLQFRGAPSADQLSIVQSLASELVSAADKAFGETDQGFAAATTQDVIDTLRNLRDVTLQQQQAAEDSLAMAIAEQTEIERQIAELSGRTADELEALRQITIGMFAQQGFELKLIEVLNRSILESGQSIVNAINGMTRLGEPISTGLTQLGAGPSTGFTQLSLTPFGLGDQSFTALAHGGLITQPTAALVGEAGPEAVIPLSQLGSFGGVTINVSGNTLLGDDAGVAQELAELIQPQLDRLRLVAV